MIRIEPVGPGDRLFNCLARCDRCKIRQRERQERLEAGEEHPAVLAKFLAGCEAEGWQFSPARDACAYHACPLCGLAELRGIVADLQLESNAYNAGMGRGRLEERSRILGILRTERKKEQFLLDRLRSGANEGFLATQAMAISLLGKMIVLAEARDYHAPEGGMFAPNLAPGG